MFCLSNSSSKVVFVSLRESLIISFNICISALAFVIKALDLFFRDTFSFFHDKNNVDEAADIAAAEKKPNPASETVIQGQS